MPMSGTERLVMLGMPTQLAKEIGGKTEVVALAANTVTATTGTLPTPGGTTVIANTATPTVVELLDFCVENRATIAAIIAALKA